MPDSFEKQLAATDVSFISPEDVKRPRARKPFARDIGISDFSRADGSRARRLKSGDFEPERTLDLHGLALGAAQERFLNFIISNHSAGIRRLLVITGSGSPERGTGKIKAEFPRWLSDPLVRDMVLAASPATKRGAPGAFYMLLRRK